jgi:pimeloyl-ACP methyl ester carboxylesterase
MPADAQWAEEANLTRAAIDRWGEGETIDWAAPTLAGNPVARRFWGTLERASMSPAMARALFAAIEREDIRDVLPAIQAPTLVIHHAAGVIPVGQGRYLAGKIAAAAMWSFPAPTMRRLAATWGRSETIFRSF